MAYESQVDDLNLRSAEYRQRLADRQALKQIMIDRNAIMLQRAIDTEAMADQAEADAGANPTNPTTPPLADDIMNSDGTVNMAARNAIADNYWNALDYRYGKKSADIPNLPVYSQRPDSLAPGYGNRRKFQMGEWLEFDPDSPFSGGDFASNVGHALWAPDDPNAYLGVSGYQATNFSNRTGAVKPEWSWTLNYEGIDNIEAKWWKDHGFPNLGKFACMGHALGRPGWATQEIVATVDGIICTVGFNTMTNRAITRLRAGCRPTAIAVSSSNEIALITYWDVINNNAGVATILLCGLGHNMTVESPTPNPANTPDGWWGEWEKAYPGMHNLGNLAFMKVVGYTELTGMLAPTAISCTTGHFRYHYLNGNEVNGTTGNTGNWEADESQRQRWASGDYANRYAKQGIALITSMSEKLAYWLDLRPIFAYINKMYFGSRAQFLQTRNVGQNPGQWPFTFEEAPEQMPVIVKKMTLEDSPTSCYVFNYCGDDKTAHRQAHIGLRNGQMITYATGGYAQPAPGNYNPTTLGNPNGIVEVGRRFVGRNPTSIEPTKEKGGTTANLIRDVTRGLMVWSREEKAARWIDLGEAAYANCIEVRKCIMAQIQDGTHLADTDNHGTESYVAMVADPTGKRVHHIVWGGTWFHTYQGQYFPLLNNEPFNYGGALEFPGAVHYAGGANVS